MEVIPTQYGRLIIKKIQSKDNSSTDNPESIHIVINPLKDVVKSFMKRLTVKINNDKTSIVAISITDPTVKKAEVFLDNLIQIYNEDVAEDKSFRQHFQIYCQSIEIDCCRAGWSGE
jgi:predicted phage tail protein